MNADGIVKSGPEITRREATAPSQETLPRPPVLQAEGTIQGDVMAAAAERGARLEGVMEARQAVAETLEFAFEEPLAETAERYYQLLMSKEPFSIHPGEIGTLRPGDGAMVSGFEVLPHAGLDYVRAVREAVPAIKIDLEEYRRAGDAIRELNYAGEAEVERAIRSAFDAAFTDGKAAADRFLAELRVYREPYAVLAELQREYRFLGGGIQFPGEFIAVTPEGARAQVAFDSLSPLGEVYILEMRLEATLEPGELQDRLALAEYARAAQGGQLAEARSWQEVHEHLGRAGLYLEKGPEDSLLITNEVATIRLADVAAPGTIGKSLGPYEGDSAYEAVRAALVARRDAGEVLSAASSIQRGRHVAVEGLRSNRTLVEGEIRQEVARAFGTGPAAAREVRLRLADGGRGSEPLPKLQGGHIQLWGGRKIPVTERARSAVGAVKRLEVLEVRYRSVGQDLGTALQAVVAGEGRLQAAAAADLAAAAGRDEVLRQSVGRLRPSQVQDLAQEFGGAVRVAYGPRLEEIVARREAWLREGLSPRLARGADELVAPARQAGEMMTGWVKQGLQQGVGREQIVRSLVRSGHSAMEAAAVVTRVAGDTGREVVAQLASRCLAISVGALTMALQIGAYIVSKGIQEMVKSR